MEEAKISLPLSGKLGSLWLEGKVKMYKVDDLKEILDIVSKNDKYIIFPLLEKEEVDLNCENLIEGSNFICNEKPILEEELSDAETLLKAINLIITLETLVDGIIVLSSNEEKLKIFTENILKYVVPKNIIWILI
ncbi:hypothetical protein Metin_0328 [Methanocaldococcus infernus ME]|uniref:Uncharacterized protein n=1 Tax=Methanocaldococcus infernus (strain DSM 11812 / JCM 15783 / ME) TaxID=573063 RepID=D5VQZ5_METIM|nr:hypothetical protein [Methanocaldococcus infernus]ADG12998.1 hypothetical protein Metin_0328 [Methanocaldococcus infernus ME]